jgi:hypothetical protein
MARTPGSFPIPTPATASDVADLIINSEDFNAIRTAIVGLLGTGSTNYNTSYRSADSIADAQLIRVENINSLHADINTAYRHQTGRDLSAIGINVQAASNAISATYFNDLYTQADTLANVSNRYTAYYTSGTPPSGYTNQLEPHTITESLRTAAWSGVVSDATSLTWASSTEALTHFNLGGKHYVSLGYTGTYTEAQDLAFIEFLGVANTAFSTYYTRTQWVAGAAVTQSVSHTTGSGVFTADLNLAKTIDEKSLDVSLTITPPVGITVNVAFSWNINTLRSTDAIKAPLYTASQYNRVLSVSASSTSFSLDAGRTSALQTLTIANGSPSNSISISGFESSSNGASVFVVGTGTNFSVNASIQPLTFPITVPPSSSIQVKVFYSRPARSTEGLGTFNNTIVINSNADYGNNVIQTQVTVTAPVFDFKINAVNSGDLYTYSDWTSDANLRAIGIRVAEKLYLPNTDFGIINGARRFGLYRRPDIDGLDTWARVCRDSFGGNENNSEFVSLFFRSIGPLTSDLSRSLTSAKSYDPGWGYGDFYDVTQSLEAISDGTPKYYKFLLTPEFGTITSYTATLSNYQFNSVPNSDLAGVFAINRTMDPSSPTVVFFPLGLDYVGTYSATLTVTATAVDLDNNTVTVSNTADIELNVTALADTHYADWLSAKSTDNGVVGISYDRIGNVPYLTVGIGMKTDGASDVRTIPNSLISTANLGLTADSMFGTGFPLYKVATVNGWSTFMNTYGVWFTNSGVPQAPFYTLSSTYSFVAPSTGTYSYEFALDDRGAFAIDGVQILYDNSESFRPGRTRTGTVYLTAGSHTVTVSGQNNANYSSGNPGGVALRLYTSTGQTVWSTLEPVRTNPPYLYWAEVYRIPLTPNLARTYQLRDYIVKNSYPVNRYSGSGTTYSRYFGAANTDSAGSFITVQHDGFGNLSFTFNTVSTLSNDTSADTTLKGIMYASYYYTDSKYRLTNLESRNPNNLTTRLIGMTKSGAVTAQVAIPSQPLVDYLEPVDTGYDAGGSDAFGFNPGDFGVDTGDTGDDGFGDTAGSGNDGGDNGAGEGGGEGGDGF